ncbi:hypothetical protein ACHDL8_003782 [Clostridioides difficile]|uniref:hypothetical protein n=1 Tax=Clostridioides difficile TaxID=1496 RepID=UPI00038DB0EB|nr:hypothetical protein [Clostridioides difficile]WMU95086.1 hypothetical protein NMPPGEIJ_00047 [Clostridioides phage AR1074-1]EGT3731184.1 hypothetical protein [Clostridioides difficile]EGT3772703.1 hypothetical protein [Clostridioides difficile]EGT3805961.1 hypothetical protein [Clostridioides difficile]EGT3881188.1 hypothetical protein [Clostridioides difficile]
MNFKMIANIPELTAKEQFEKVLEEVLELKEAIELKDNKKIMEEGLDVIQAIFTLFKVLKIDKEIREGLKLHNKKLRKRKWKLEKIN